ncbi:MAG: hypothetical protein IKF38_03290 [Clostridia bacterium]|nr:hypothetical protein [Clostridia bacterium]
MQNNLNPEMMNNIKNLVDNGNISDAISQISPEMIENFSKMMNSNNSDTSNKNSQSGSTSSFSSSNNTYSQNNSGFDFSNIDMNTILKMKSVMENMNNKNDPRSNLLYSLKPYLRQNKQEKLDQYVNLLNFSKIADVLKSEKRDDKNV